jgi:hypothetical protein
VPTRSGYARLCVDGPVLDAAELERVEEPAGCLAEPSRAHSANANTDAHTARELAS